MYFPYLRGKQFELEALLEVSPTVYRNTLPIVEPVSIPRSKLYDRLAKQKVPLILIMNPQYGVLDTNGVQQIVDGDLSTHPSLVLGFIIGTNFTAAALNTFLANNPSRSKALIFRYSPLPTDISNIQRRISAHPVQYIIFDDRKSNSHVRSAFNSHPNKVLVTDGFQHQDKNANYPSSSTFDSNFGSWRGSGWFGIGDYLTIGDRFNEGGGPVYVVSLHITTRNGAGLLAYHFSSTVSSTIKGLAPIKFAQANDLLVNSRHISPLRSSGLALYRNWHSTSHNPQLGAAKKASIMHHIELMSSLV